MKASQMKLPGYYWGTNPDKTDTTIYKVTLVGGDENRIHLESFYGHLGTSKVWDGWTFSGPLGMPAIADGGNDLKRIMEGNAWRDRKSVV